MESNLTERIGLSALMTLLGLGVVLSVDAHTGQILARWIVSALIG